MAPKLDDLPSTSEVALDFDTTMKCKAAPATTQDQGSIVTRLFSWDHPLSRDDKMRRVLSLYSQELASADEQLRCHEEFYIGDDRSEADSSDKDEGLASDASRHPFQRLGTVSRFVILTGFVAFGCLTLLTASNKRTADRCLALLNNYVDGSSGWQEGSCPRKCPSPLEVFENSNGTVEESYSLRMASSMNATDSVLVSGYQPNVTAVYKMWQLGIEQLKASNCWDAEMWFSSTLFHYDFIGDSSLLEHLDRAVVIANLGFAQICAHKFQDGVDILERELESRGVDQMQAHLVNALGFGHYNLKQYERASDVFQLAATSHPDNPILWNNLAASKLVVEDVLGADEALDRAFATDLFAKLDDYHKDVLLTNYKILDILNTVGHVEELPHVELFSDLDP